jgi:hypothetical protein
VDLGVKVIGIANGGKDYQSLRSIRKKLVMLTVENQIGRIKEKVVRYKEEITIPVNPVERKEKMVRT